MDLCKKTNPFYRFIADVHLPNDPASVKQFCHLIQQTPRSCKGLYILGDLFDHWLGQDLYQNTYNILQACLKALPFPVFFLAGNKDFLLEDQWLSKANVIKIPDPYCLTIKHHRILLTHGDQYCSNDTTYQWFRWLIRRKSTLRLFRALPKQTRLNMFSAIRKHQPSHAHLAKTYQLNTQLIGSDLNQYDATLAILGHVHHPGYLALKKTDKHYIILPDWRRMHTLATVDLQISNSKLHCYITS